MCCENDLLGFEDGIDVGCVKKKRKKSSFYEVVVK